MEEKSHDSQVMKSNLIELFVNFNDEKRFEFLKTFQPTNDQSLTPLEIFDRGINLIEQFDTETVKKILWNFKIVSVDFHRGNSKKRNSRRKRKQMKKLRSSTFTETFIRQTAENESIDGFLSLNLSAVNSSSEMISSIPSPFHRTICCVFENDRILQSNQIDGVGHFHGEFLLSAEICNQLGLSVDFDPISEDFQTKLKLLLRFVRIDDRNSDGKEMIFPKINLKINETNVEDFSLTNDLKFGSTIDITPYCMFNPMLKNSLSIEWSIQSGDDEFQQNQYAMNIFLVDHLTIDEIFEEVLKKSKENRRDFHQTLKNVSTNSTTINSEHFIPLFCPMSRERIKCAAKSISCDHLHCFDLKTFLTANENSTDWLCPICRRKVNLEDLQVDDFIQSVLEIIVNDSEIIAILIDAALEWKPVILGQV